MYLVITSAEALSFADYVSRHTASLRPTARVVHHNALGKRYAQAITESWNPVRRLPIVTMPAAEFDALAQHSTTFTGE